jgi:ApbE superfamily uncharacterized protein (UPF0280 family)
MGPHRALLDGHRLHLQHGPIDLIIAAKGDAFAVGKAHEAAWARFQTILTELVAELVLLKGPVKIDRRCPVKGPVAVRMWNACAPFYKPFITPMAAVAGAVADEIAVFYRTAGVESASINNGGDIALHLSGGTALNLAVVPDIDRATGHPDRIHYHTLKITSSMPVRGVATSGWRGRSFSLGIADSVTVAARTAAMADSAATIVANAVNTDYIGIRRAPAWDLQTDSDLEDRLVTVEVPPLPPSIVANALDMGASAATLMLRYGLIHCAMLTCQRQMRVVEPATGDHFGLRATLTRSDA